MQNVIELSAAVLELSCWQRKTYSAENKRNVVGTACSTK